MLPEPRVDALPVEQVAALRQLPEDVAVAVVVQAYGAARARCALLGLAVHHLRVPLQSGLVDAELNVVRLVAAVASASACASSAAAAPGRGLPRRVGGSDGRAGAEVGGERDGGDEEEDADGDADAVAEAADAVGAEHAHGVAVARRQPHGRRAAGAHRGVPWPSIGFLAGRRASR